MNVFPLPKIVVLGSGHTGHAIAASFSRAHYPVTLVSMTRTQEAVQAARSENVIQLTIAGKTTSYPMDYSDNIGAAISRAHIIFCTVPALHHETVMLKMLPHLRSGQYLYFSSYFAAMRMRYHLRNHPLRQEIAIVESMSAIYAARSPVYRWVEVIAIKDRVPLSSYTADQAIRFIRLVERALPCFELAPDVLFTSLNNVGPILHVPLMLFNVGRIEASSGLGWNLYQEGLTPTVIHYIEKLDRERRAIADALEVSSYSLADIMLNIFYQQQHGGVNNFWDWIRSNNIHASNTIGTPSGINTRYLTEGVYFGLQALAQLANQLHLPAETIHNTVRLGEGLLEPYAVTKNDHWDYLSLPWVAQVKFFARAA